VRARPPAGFFFFGSIRRQGSGLIDTRRWRGVQAGKAGCARSVSPAANSSFVQKIAVVLRRRTAYCANGRLTAESPRRLLVDGGASRRGPGRFPDSVRWPPTMGRPLFELGSIAANLVSRFRVSSPARTIRRASALGNAGSHAPRSSRSTSPARRPRSS